MVKPQKVGGKMGGAIKRIPNPTKASLKGEMKVNKIFGSPYASRSAAMAEGKKNKPMTKIMKKRGNMKKTVNLSSKEHVMKSLRKTMGY